MKNMIEVSVVFCDIQQCYQKTVLIAEHSSIEHAIQQSGLAEQLKLPNPLNVGIFGLKMPLDHKVNAGDRIEIYRPLHMNPKDIRRKRAEKHPVGRFQRGNQFRKQQLKANQTEQKPT